MREIFEGIKNALERNENGALVTITRTIGSTPRKPGAKMLILSGGQVVGTVGGGCVEGDIWREAKEVIRTGRPKKMSLRLTGDGESNSIAELFIEPIGNEAPSINQ